MILCIYKFVDGMRIIKLAIQDLISVYLRNEFVLRSCFSTNPNWRSAGT